jgi:flagellar basal-body rod protein FlgB
MDSPYLFNVASQQTKWLSVRQAAIAGNVANANTPGYKAVDVEPFEATLANTQLAMAVTNPEHMTDATGGAPPAEIRQRDPWNLLYSGNDVSLEQEMMKANEVNRAHSLNTSIIKTFNRLLISGAKG